ncbi:bi-domain-containing oxidoreductase [Syntrophus aciditrophicus]|uniref:Oxidoreductase n=1 Tax=Syntrophus aciditrophicus (strain SB) TaxID=56780 RepID=Q2LWL7_SYNAS|nr:bi-domain-containing oxidoreductase [Syntrophus aciditrophicus]ABC78477.1 Oxidoreductase [Syntrophus aciditrophicus SB]
MKQLIQNLKTGETFLEEVPVPKSGLGQVLIKTTHSLVSLGTERMLVEFGRASLIQKARQQPDKVKQVLDKIKTEGLLPTLEAVFKRLNEPLPLGYCNAGVVVETGDGVSEFKVGDRVASNGPHAEYVCVPQNLAAKIPDAVSDEEAAFTVIGSIGLQGIRLCQPSLGETIVVFGLGLIGLITAQLLNANGCRVIGIDLDPSKLAMARQMGCTTIDPRESDTVAAVMQQTADIGADGVIITASAKTDDVISQSARMSRKRGRIILIGVVGLNLNRAEFYEKELTFQVSSSYGPGRYDENYEQKGQDYPIGFVRWTEKRNFEAVLQAIASGLLDVKSLITERVRLDDFQKIYGSIGRSHSIASILVYSGSDKRERAIPIISKSFNAGKSLGIIGAGNFTKMTVLPALKKAGTPISFISSANGLSGTHLAKSYGIASSTTDYWEILSNPAVSMVMITTRHNLHARMVVECLKAGKDVFVEKPLALTPTEFEEIRTTYLKGSNSLTVGFNRRFSPHIQAIKKALGDQPGPISIVATMNAGAISPSVWVHDMEIGGGRIIGEACHYLDLLVYLTGSLIEGVCMNALGPNPKENTDNASLLLRFANGSNGVINYFANGHKAYSKERVEVYSQGRIAIMDNFRKTEAYGFSGFKGLKTSIDKGHETQFKLLTDRLNHGGEALIPFSEIENVTLASFAAIESLKKGEWVKI